MFDIGWSELVVIAVVALIAIGPKELPGVLRMVGQWMGKARKMAAEFQGQFQEAMREAEMADLKKSFDEVKDVATGLSPANVMTSLQKDVSDALQIGDIDKPATTENDAQVASAISEPIIPGTIQVPESGQPIITMRDGPTVGGYAKLGVVDERDISWLAQVRPGRDVRFQLLHEIRP